MNEPGPTLWLAKSDLSDEAAAQLLDFLHELLTAFENAYFDQLHRYHATREHSAESIHSPQRSDPNEDPF
jgi:hypothetical protein